MFIELLVPDRDGVQSCLVARSEVMKVKPARHPDHAEIFLKNGESIYCEMNYRYVVKLLGYTPPVPLSSQEGSGSGDCHTLKTEIWQVVPDIAMWKGMDTLGARTIQRMVEIPAGFIPVPDIHFKYPNPESPTEVVLAEDEGKSPILGKCESLLIDNPDVGPLSSLDEVMAVTLSELKHYRERNRADGANRFFFYAITYSEVKKPEAWVAWAKM